MRMVRRADKLATLVWRLSRRSGGLYLQAPYDLADNTDFCAEMILECKRFYK